MRNSTTYKFQKELLKYINEPDQGLPRNLKNHIQTPDGYGDAKEMIMERFNACDVRGLAHALHYTQDICNPLHTVKDYPIDKHIAYELMISNVEFEFVPGKVLVFAKGVEDGIDSIVALSNSMFIDLKHAIDRYIIDDIVIISKKSLSMAASATHGLIKMHLASDV
jgi:hypothetical protein